MRRNRKDSVIQYVSIICIVFFLTTSIALGEHEVWDCPACGRTGNTGNYCGACAHPAPWIITELLAKYGLAQPTTEKELEIALQMLPELRGYLSLSNTETVSIEKSDPTIRSSINSEDVGSTVRFGSYEQDGDISNGAEPIEWLVLSADNNSALLISKFALDSLQYDQTKEGQTWENCYLRKWLNTDFLNAAFTSSERKYIKQTLVDNKKMTSKDPHTSYQWVPSDAKGGSNTKDYVYILSGDEVENLLKTEIARQCTATHYAEQQGALLSTVNSNVWWWLRSPKSFGGVAYLVNSMGTYDTYEQNKAIGFTVRPVLRLILQ